MKLVGRIPRARVACGQMVRIAYAPSDALVTLVDGEPSAIADACNHAGASLAEGIRTGPRVACPMHGYVFHLRTGELIAPRGYCAPQRKFVTTVDADDILVWDPAMIEIRR